MDRTEFIIRGNSDPIELAPGLALRVFASQDHGSQGLTTCAVTASPGAGLPYHTHPTGESITLALGEAEVSVEGRRYRLHRFDSIHVPAGIAHAVNNRSDGIAVLHTVFPTGAVERDFVDGDFPEIAQDDSSDLTPETLIRFRASERYEVSVGVEARNLFAGRFGSRGMCGGYGLFRSDSGLPCHIHDYDESITIVGGRAVCQVAGREYELSDFDTACIPRGRPHRFVNQGQEPMEMIWVYAGDEPDRVLVDQRCCDSGTG